MIHAFVINYNFFFCMGLYGIYAPPPLPPSHDKGNELLVVLLHFCIRVKRKGGEEGEEENVIRVNGY